MIRRLVLFPCLCACFLLMGSNSLLAQTPATGLPPLGTFGGSQFDTVNLANLDVHFQIPVFSRAGRGIPLSYSLGYDSLIWVPANSSGAPGWTPISSTWGWRAVTEAATGYVSYGGINSTYCYYGENPRLIGGDTITYTNFSYHDPAGGIHPLPAGTTIRVITIINGACGIVGTTLYPFENKTAADNSGYIVTSNRSTATGPATVNARGGLTIITPDLNQTTGAGSIADANGNQISISAAGAITDTLGTALTVSGSPSSGSMTYTYDAPGSGGGGTPVNVTVSYTQQTVQTCFGISGITEFSATPEYLVSKVTLPDQTTYQFTYEQTLANGSCTPESGAVTGRIASITLPTGGQVTYYYNGNNVNDMMADGSPWYMQRGYGGGTWNYWRLVQSGQPATQTTTQVLDPAQNETDTNFSTIYQTSTNTYQGNTIWGSSRTLLKSTRTCYNDTFTNNCQTAVTPPINDIYRYDDMTNQGIYSISVDGFDTYGNTLWEHNYNYGISPSIFREVNINYNGSLCSSKNICDHPSSVQVTDANNTQYALTNYSNYDGNGNLKEVDSWVGGSSYLSTYYSYNSNSNYTLNTVTDPKGTITQYGYGSNSCNGVFPDSISVPGDQATITYDYSYNCTGGVVTQITDVANNHWGGAGYNDPYFWRPAYTFDLSGYVTYYNYYGVNNSGNSSVNQVGQVESLLTNNSNSVVDQLTTADTYGRTALVQTREAPESGTWDTVEYLYDGNGRTSYVTFPFAGSAGTYEGAKPSTGYFYDGLNRYTEIATFDGQNQLSYTNFVYNENDVETTLGPAPGGEHSKSRQYEYDALGRLTSVCELLPSGGGSACSQNSSPGNGYMTNYSYDPLGDLTQVNQSGQGRTYSYDGLSRMTAESDPESGSTTYTYDSVGGSYCAVASGYSSLGDLVAKADANGNHVCYWYDATHRLTDVANNRQSSSNPCQRFRYDNWVSPPSGVTIGNVVGQMTEAKTDDCNGNTLTNEWFSHSPRGEVTDFYESTPNSGGYYHLSNSYAADGAILGRAGYLATGGAFTNGLSYSLDGEGRAVGLTDTTINKALWSGTTYNAASQPNQVQFYSGDSESFTWDWRGIGQMVSPGSMLSWASTVGSKQQSGSLTWNENGTLQQLAIQDTANISDPQTCTYLYDDLERIGGSSTTPGVNCVNGSQNVWQQMFTYDAFGNINKSGNSSFQALYTANNQISNLGFVYDSNGNVTNDGANTYTYNVYNRPVTAGGNSATYDAFNRLVEVGGGSNTQIVYAPDGFKFAYMNGQTVSKYLVPLAAGVQAVYTAATPAAPAYWMHSDWLSSVRLTSAPNQTTVAGQAYAPFGEGYGTYFHGGTNDFTGQTQDVVSGIYDFTFRQYSPVQGRWQTPDPAGLGAVDTTNPQTWNRYAYVANNPLSNVDPLGLYIVQCTYDGDSNCDYYTWAGSCFGCFAYGVGGGGGGGGGGRRNPPPPPPPMQQPINFPNETLGLPNGFPTNPWGIAGAIIPSANCGDISCLPIGNAWTGQVGVSAGWTFPWGINVNWFAGFACDLQGHCAFYRGSGVGAAQGARLSAGVQLGASNAATVCGLAGPFVNASGTFGVQGVAGTADVFQGKGNGPGGVVTGGGVTLGVGAGGSASVGGTSTTVVPFGGYSCP